MVGNDVVDLRDPDTAPGSTSARFDARVFCEEEQDSLASSACRSERRWRLWAAKEAAYKVSVKRDPTTAFVPSRFRVRLADDLRSAIVETPVGPVPVLVRTEDDVLHAVAATTARDEIVFDALRMPWRDPRRGSTDPGAAVRRFALERLARELEVAPEALEIRKQGRVPVLWQSGAPARGDLSLSHHGGAIAFAYERTPDARFSARCPQAISSGSVG